MPKRKRNDISQRFPHAGVFNPRTILTIVRFVSVSFLCRKTPVQGFVPLPSDILMPQRIQIIMQHLSLCESFFFSLQPDENWGLTQTEQFVLENPNQYRALCRVDNYFLLRFLSAAFSRNHIIQEGWEL